MNTYTIYLSSSDTSTHQHLDPLVFDDFTKLNINLLGITEAILPCYLKIDWGIGGDVELYDNNVYRVGRDTVDVLRFSPIFTNTYSQEYYPSSYALYKTLSSQVLVNYSNGDNSLFVIPIKIRTYDYFESLEDLKLKNTNILGLSGNTLEHQLIATKDNQLIEMIQG